jgi:hypothetical protein
VEASATSPVAHKVRPGLKLLLVLALAMAVLDATGISGWLVNASRNADRALLVLAAIGTTFGCCVLWKDADAYTLKTKWDTVGAGAILTVSIATYALYTETPAKYFIHFHLLNAIASILFQWQEALAIFGLVGPFFARGRSRAALLVSGLLMLLLWNARAEHLAELMTPH